MTLQTEPAARPNPGDRNRPTMRAAKPGWFRAFWRWHFYAAFLVVPVLLVLSTTGLIYLFRFQLEPLMHGDQMLVEKPADMDFAQPYSAQLAAVERAHPDATVVSMTEPRNEGRSTMFSVVTESGEPRDVYVNPWGAEVLGEVNPDTTLSGYAVRLHRDLMAGRWGDHVMELGACWALVMALTGYYLYWKGRTARRRRPKSLRSRHGRIGLVAGVGLLLLLITGLPWTGVWGEKVQTLATDRGSSLWSTDPGALSDPTSTLDESLPHSHQQEVPWGSGKSEVPRSSGHAGSSVANIDTAIEVADEQGLRHPMTVALPTTEDGVFSVIGYAFDAPSDEKTVHVGRFGGEVESTYGYDDYPGLAKVVAQGIGLHEGRSLGLWSFWGAALMCLTVMASCITGPLMWWRRRPRRSARSGGAADRTLTTPAAPVHDPATEFRRPRVSMRAPRGRMPLRTTPTLVLALVALGVLLPLFGLSLLAVLALDHLLIRRVPALSHFFDSR
ncbi:PepSY domain-containing protein [Nocardioides sp. JQ2195]|uniref:PepSY-associated TM helix domain-containing protein n=1 Tax=Nocardioides sp. JQ2195 TaxID=2592334 RepID=UPI001F0CE954|nr:PepSY domain-containing protein [Nocardioides sp. JQ2195]